MKGASITRNQQVQKAILHSVVCKCLFLQRGTHNERPGQCTESYPLYLKLFNALRA